MSLKTLFAKLDEVSRKAMEEAAGLCLTKRQYEVDVEHRRHRTLFHRLRFLEDAAIVITCEILLLRDGARNAARWRLEGSRHRVDLELGRPRDRSLAGAARAADILAVAAVTTWAAGHALAVCAWAPRARANIFAGIRGDEQEDWQH